MKKYLFAVLLTLMTHKAYAENWVFIIDDNIAKQYTDLDSLTVEHFANGKPYLTAWERAVFHELQQDVAEIRSFNYYDCQNRRIADSAFVFYDQDTNIIAEDVYEFISDDNDPNWQPLIEGALSERHFDYACAVSKNIR